MFPRGHAGVSAGPFMACSWWCSKVVIVAEAVHAFAAATRSMRSHVAGVRLNDTGRRCSEYKGRGTCRSNKSSFRRMSAWVTKSSRCRCQAEYCSINDSGKLRLRRWRPVAGRPRRRLPGLTGCAADEASFGESPTAAAIRRRSASPRASPLMIWSRDIAVAPKACLSVEARHVQYGYRKLDALRKHHHAARD